MVMGKFQDILGLRVGHSRTVRSFHEFLQLLFHGMHVVPEYYSNEKVINPVDNKRRLGSLPMGVVPTGQLKC